MDEIIINSINSSGCGNIEDFQLQATKQSQFKSEPQKVTQSLLNQNSNSEIKNIKTSNFTQKSEIKSQKTPNDASTDIGFGEEIQGSSYKSSSSNNKLFASSPRKDSIIKEQEKPKTIIKENKFNLQESLDQQLKFQHQLQQNEQFLVDVNEQIFRRILDKKEMDLFNKSQECQILCTKKPKIQCNFCGKWVCSKHCTKQRQNPQYEQKFHDICNICDDKYIKKVIYEDYLEKINLFQNFTQIYEAQYGQNSESVRQKIEERRNLSDLIQTEQKENIQSQNDITNEICEQRQQIQDHEKNLLLLEEELQQAQQDLNNFDFEYMKIQQQGEQIKQSNSNTVLEIQNMLEDNQEKEYIVNFLNLEFKNSKFKSNFEEKKSNH